MGEDQGRVRSGYEDGEACKEKGRDHSGRPEEARSGDEEALGSEEGCGLTSLAAEPDCEEGGVILCSGPIRFGLLLLSTPHNPFLLHELYIPLIV